MADGTPLPSTIIFKLKSLPKGVKFPNEVVVCAHEKGWMDESSTLEWLEKVWNKRKGTAFHKTSMLVWDSFWAHIMDAVKKKCRRLNMTVDIVPGSLRPMH